MNLQKLYTTHGPIHVDVNQLAKGRTILTIYTRTGRKLSETGKTKDIRERASFGVHKDNLFASPELAEANLNRIYADMKARRKIIMKTKPEFKPTQDMIHAATAVFTCMAIEQTIRPIVEKYQREILEKGQYHIAKKWIDRGAPDRVITDPAHTYLIEDDDFAEYLSESNKARKAAGLHVKSEEFCPLLVAQSNLIKAENLLIDVMEPMTKIKSEDVYLENRAKIIDLTLRLLAPFVEVKPC